MTNRAGGGGAAANRAGGGGAAVASSTSEMLDWLTRLWLEPGAKQSLDAENWLKVYRSLQTLEPGL